MIKTIGYSKNKIGLSIFSNSISKNISSPNKSRKDNQSSFLNSSSSTINSKNTIINKNNNINFYSTKNHQSVISFLKNNSNNSINNINNNNNKNKLQIKRNYYTLNSRFHNRYGVNSQNLNEIYRILKDVSMSSFHKTATIRVSFFNQNNDKCDIKGVKLYGNRINGGGGLIVIIGSHDSTQWNNIALSVYLTSLLANQPLKNFDVIILPTENPQPISSVNTARRNEIVMSKTLSQIQQSGNASTLTSSTSSSTPISTPTSTSASTPTDSSTSTPLSSFVGSPLPNPIFCGHQIYPGFGNPLINGYNSNTEGCRAIKEWLKKYRKEFEVLNINKDYSIKHVGKSPISSESYTPGLVVDESNEHLSSPSNIPNFIFNIKDFNISPNFSSEELYALGSNLANQLNELDKMYTYKKLTPVGF